MKHILIAAVASLGLVSAAAAQTSTTVTTTTGGAAATTGAVTIQPEIRTKMKEYVTTQKSPSVAVPSGFTVSTDAVLPQSIELQTFPATVGVTQYRYAVVGDQTVLVDPGSRRIVEVIR